MDLLERSARQLRDTVAQGEVRAAELVESAFERIAALDRTINAVVTISETALDEARALDDALAGGLEPGPLCGLPVGIKDVTPTAGLRTTYGSRLYAENVPEEDAEVVRRLRAAGAIVVGKTNVPEFAAGGNTFNEVFGATRNPWDPSKSAGGSTGGGAAALAAGMVAIAEGTDLGGSLRIPASFCGVVGLRPTVGLVPTWPTAHAWDTLQASGPMARTAEDAALALAVMAGSSPLAPLGSPPFGDPLGAADRVATGAGRRRLAYCSDPAGLGVDPRIAEICRSTALELRQAGMSVEEVELDLSSGCDAFLALRSAWMVAHHHHHLGDLETLGPNLGGNIRAGLELSGERLGAAEQERGRIWHRVRELLEHYDHVLAPCMVIPPFPVEQNYPTEIAGRPMKTYVDWIASTSVFSLTGLPVASVPCGLDGGLPVGLQILGRPLADLDVLALATDVQKARPIGLPKLQTLA